MSINFVGSRNQVDISVDSSNHPIFKQQFQIEEASKGAVMKVCKKNKGIPENRKWEKRFKNEAERWSRSGMIKHKGARKKINSKRYVGGNYPETKSSDCMTALGVGGVCLTSFY